MRRSYAQFGWHPPTLLFPFRDLYASTATGSRPHSLSVLVALISLVAAISNTFDLPNPLVFAFQQAFSSNIIIASWVLINRIIYFLDTLPNDYLTPIAQTLLGRSSPVRVIFSFILNSNRFGKIMLLSPFICHMIACAVSICPPSNLVSTMYALP